jgi:hypothetical protein
MNYKAPDNSLHFIEAEFAHLLPAGCVPITQEEADVLRAPPPKTQAEQFKDIERAFEQHMDEVAQLDGWDNRWTCVARAGYVNPWQAKGIKFAQWMDACWVIAIQAQNDVIAGLRTIPTPEEAVLELPAIVW